MAKGKPYLFLNRKESYIIIIIAGLFYQLRCKRKLFPDKIYNLIIVNIIELIRSLGCLISSVNLPVIFIYIKDYL